MCVKGEATLPQFYSEYVKEIQARIEADADLEFNCIWKEHQRTGIHRFLLTDQVSDKINDLNAFIQSSSLWNNIPLRHTVLSYAIPRKLQQLLGLDAIVQRVPDQYIQAIFGAYLASRYVYKHGLGANEMAFFEFMQPYLTQTLQRQSTINVTPTIQATTTTEKETTPHTTTQPQQPPVVEINEVPHRSVPATAPTTSTSTTSTRRSSVGSSSASVGLPKQQELHAKSATK